VKVDRGLFLALVGTIGAGGACKTTQTNVGVPTMDLPIPGSAGPTVAGWPDGGSSTSQGPEETCDDSKGDPPACATMAHEDSSCAPFEFPHSQCAGFVPLLKPGAAERFVTCMTRLTPTELCDAMRTYKCKEDALVNACPDPSVNDYCSGEGIDDDPQAKAACKAHAGGLNEAGRDRMGRCGSTPCIEGLLQET
jgi:hypothetical protein